MTKEEIKKTLNIPKTPFAMNANASVNDPKMIDWWIEHNIYNKALIRNQNKPQKILHDGPPYANGKLHMGHAMNKILKDMFVRHWNMQGYYSQYVMGWDVHGLPIEHALIKLGVNTDPSLSIVQKRDNCWNFAQEQIQIQKAQFRAMGIFTDYNVVYKTNDSYIEFPQLRLFNSMIEKGLVYKALKPVYWSWSSQSALAEDEIEYHDDESDSIYVTFDLDDEQLKDTALLIWTTTPWTIPADLAVSVHPNFVYLQIQVNNKKYIVAKSRLEALSKKFKWQNVQILKEFNGTELENKHYIHPLYTKERLPIIIADYVTAEDGTGLVHNAPAFGLDDYKVCLKYGINTEYCPIDNYGCFNNTVKSPELVGKFYKDANPMIIEWLKESGHLLEATRFTHSVAFDWRTKKPVIYRATAQWFINLDKIRDKLVGGVQNSGIHFVSDWAKKNLTYMIGHREEWCISRQRYWGVPIPIVYDENDEPILDTKLISHIIDLLEQANTSNIWFEKPVEYFLTDEYLKTGKKYRKETDIMDVWFDSGATHNMFKHYGWSYPVEMYLEGTDQYRGWFNSSSITGIIEHNVPPFKVLISHGFILDEKGNKMSKSLGNGIDPEDMERKYGNDAFRLWVASSNWYEDVRLGDNIMKQVVENYRRIRNTLLRFQLSNLYDFDPTQELQSKLEIEDLFILKQLKENIQKINDWFDNYNLLDIIKLISNVTVTLSNWYFDIIKDALYCEHKHSLRRKQVQTVLYYLFTAYNNLLAPLLPFTTEEAYQTIKDQFHWQAESIFLTDYVQADFLKAYDFSKIDDLMFGAFFKVKDLVYAKLEKLRNEKVINKNNEAIVYLNNQKLIDTIGAKKLAIWLNVAKVVNSDQLKVEKADSFALCDRCWNYFEETLDEDCLCQRCHNAVKNH